MTCQCSTRTAGRAARELFELAAFQFEEEDGFAREGYAFETIELEAEASPPTVRRGSRGAAVEDLQRRLNAAGFDAGIVDGIFGSDTDRAVQAFQRARGLHVDGIVGPDTWGALLAAPPAPPGPNTSGSAVELAGKILRHTGITLWTRSPVSSSGTDGADARSNIADTAAGRAARRSHYGTAPGGTVALDPRMLSGMLALAGVYRFGVTAIAGGSHSATSRHYAGIAFDVYEINGARVTASNPHFRAFMQRSRDLGATEVLGPGSAGHDTHVHCAWPREGGAAGGTSPAPAATPAPPAPSGELPRAWGDGPVNPPAWKPALRRHAGIRCGLTEIPVQLAPESVSDGWTPRTSAVAAIIKGPLFGWRNVEGQAQGSQSGHVNNSFHYCGRAIDAFPPGVAWDTRASGEGLKAGWRLANWAAHNAAAQHIAEVIFYDRIWTVARSAEGWRPYGHPSGSTQNSKQHRDHVHISVY